MKRRLELDDIPELPGYLTVAAVAEKYGVGKGSIYNMVYSQLRFKNVFKITKGGNGGDKRPLILLLETEVARVFSDKSQYTVSDPELAARRSDWRKRVKTWGRADGWNETPIAVSGPPHASLVHAYLQANPDDPMPESD